MKNRGQQKCLDKELAVYVNNKLSSVLTYNQTILFLVGIYLFKVDYKNTRKWCKIFQNQQKRHQNDVNRHEHTVN